jgi:hypothetical protein
LRHGRRGTFESRARRRCAGDRPWNGSGNSSWTGSWGCSRNRRAGSDTGRQRPPIGSDLDIPARDWCRPARIGSLGGRLGHRRSGRCGRRCRLNRGRCARRSRRRGGARLRSARRRRGAGRGLRG